MSLNYFRIASVTSLWLCRLSKAAGPWTARLSMGQALQRTQVWIHVTSAFFSERKRERSSYVACFLSQLWLVHIGLMWVFCFCFSLFESRTHQMWQFASLGDEDLYSRAAEDRHQYWFLWGYTHAHTAKVTLRNNTAMPSCYQRTPWVGVEELSSTWLLSIFQEGIQMSDRK